MSNKKKVTLKSIFQDAFGEEFDGMNESQNKALTRSFNEFGSNFEKIPEARRNGDIKTFSNAIVDTMDEDQRNKLAGTSNKIVRNNKSDRPSLVADITTEAIAADPVGLAELVGDIAISAGKKPMAFDGSDIVAEGLSEAAKGFSEAASDGGAAEAAAEGAGFLEGVGEVAGSVAEAAGDVLGAVGETLGEIIGGLSP